MSSYEGGYERAKEFSDNPYNKVENDREAGGGQERRNENVGRENVGRENVGREEEKDLCGDFQQGRCFRSVCKFSHQFRDGGEVPRGRADADAGRGGSEECKDFLRGRCTRGRHCRYTHAQPVRNFYDPPPFSGYGSLPYNYYDSPLPPPMYPYYPPQDGYGRMERDGYGYGRMERDGYGRMERPEEICRDYLRNRCTRGDACRYLHKKEVCGDFLRGNCHRPDCRYSHNREDGERCLDFQRGTCNRGEDCRYFHDDGSSGPTDVCRDFLADRCKRHDCKFRHDEEELAKKRKLDNPTSSSAQSDGFGDDSGRPAKMIKS